MCFIYCKILCLGSCKGGMARPIWRQTRMIDHSSEWAMTIRNDCFGPEHYGGPVLANVWASCGHSVLAQYWWPMSRPSIDTLFWPCAGNPCLGQLWTHGSGPVLATHVWASSGHTVLALCWQPMFGPAVDTLFWAITWSAQCGPLQHGPCMVHVSLSFWQTDLAPDQSDRP